MPGVEAIRASLTVALRADRALLRAKAAVDRITGAVLAALGLRLVLER